MNTGVTHFKKGNAIARAKAGKKHKRTLLREKLGIERLEDLRYSVLNVWTELLNSRSMENRKFAAKELSRYLFSMKVENEVNKFFSWEETLKRVKKRQEERKMQATNASSENKNLTNGLENEKG